MRRPFRERVRPALAHAPRLRRLQAAPGPAPGHAVREPVRVLVRDDVVLERAVAVGARQVPDEHAHVPALAVWGRREVRVVGPRAVLDGDRDAVVALAALAEVVVLEVERGLGEAVLVLDVVHRVHDVERVDACGVDVGRVEGGDGQVRVVVEDET